MKIKTTITEKREVEIDVELPYFCKKGDEFLKVISERSAIKIYTSNNWKSVTLADPLPFGWTFNAGEFKECTEEEFNAAYHHVLMVTGQHVPPPPVPGELMGEELTMTTESLNQ